MRPPPAVPAPSSRLCLRPQLAQARAAGPALTACRRRDGPLCFRRRPPPARPSSGRGDFNAAAPRTPTTHWDVHTREKRDTHHSAGARRPREGRADAEDTKSNISRRPSSSVRGRTHTRTPTETDAPHPVYPCQIPVSNFSSGTINPFRKDTGAGLRAGGRGCGRPGPPALVPAVCPSELCLRRRGRTPVRGSRRPHGRPGLSCGDILGRAGSGGPPRDTRTCRPRRTRSPSPGRPWPLSCHPKTVGVLEGEPSFPSCVWKRWRGAAAPGRAGPGPRLRPAYFLGAPGQDRAPSPRTSCTPQQPTVKGRPGPALRAAARDACAAWGKGWGARPGPGVRVKTALPPELPAPCTARACGSGWHSQGPARAQPWPHGRPGRSPVVAASCASGTYVSTAPGSPTLVWPSDLFADATPSPPGVQAAESGPHLLPAPPLASRGAGWHGGRPSGERRAPGSWQAVPGVLGGGHGGGGPELLAMEEGPDPPLWLRFPGGAVGPRHPPRLPHRALWTLTAPCARHTTGVRQEDTTACQPGPLPTPRAGPPPGPAPDTVPPPPPVWWRQEPGPPLAALTRSHGQLETQGGKRQ